MTGQGVRIPSMDAKDLYISNHLREPDPQGYSLIRKDGTVNMNRFINSLDYSLDLIKLREVYQKVYRNKHFSFMANDYEYSSRVINVTFKYSVKEFNLIGSNVYIKFGYRFSEVPLKHCVVVQDGELVAIQTDVKVPQEHALPPEMLNGSFVYQDGMYKVRQNKTIIPVAHLRQELYTHGFTCNGVHYVRFKRSSGSSRVGKCLFIDEKLYPAMHRYEMCGLKVKRGQQIDLAALEAYIALTLSSIIDTVDIPPESILVIDDYDSVFKDKVIATRIIDGQLHTGEEEVTIKNSIWDGQSLIDPSVMGEYSGFGMILLRNFFFKSCCFNTNIQQWFQDNGITEISQLNGFTLATDVFDIKLITTPNSIKYLKFGTVQEWLHQLNSTFGVVKHEKKTHFFDGRMVQTHYQLLNTLQLSKEEMAEFLKPSFEYMDLLKTEPAVFRYHIKHPGDFTPQKQPYDSVNDVVFQLMGINEKFPQTKLYRNFCTNSIEGYKRNMLYGHILVNGNYSTLFGNPMEMLLQTIGRFDGKSLLGKEHVHSTRFEYGACLLGSRSPHINAGNILLTTNVADENIDRYFNLTSEIVCINSIGENILQRLNGADYDSDTVLLTDNEILIRAARKNYDKFLVPTNLTESTKIPRYYTPEQQADLDVKTSVNKIGEIVNLSQELQTLMWHKINNGASFEDVKDLYYDTCRLCVMSGIEIDKAKKEFDVDNELELRMLREKWQRRDDDNRIVKPYFFGHVDKTKGFYNTKRKNYLKHDTSMDYLREIINSYRSPRLTDPQISLTNILRDAYDHDAENRRQIKSILYEIDQFKKTSYYIWNGFAETSDQYQRYVEAEDAMITEINGMTLNPATIFGLVRRIEQDTFLNISDFVMKLLFNIGNSAAYSLIKHSQETISMIEEDPDGDITIYGTPYKKSQKTPKIYTKNEI